MADGRPFDSPVFGDLLRRLRTAAGLSQQLLAERSRMSVEAIGALERGLRRAPQQRTVELLIEALALNPEDRGELETAAQRGRARSRRPQNSGAAAHDNLPASATSFVGRSTEMAALHSLLLERRCRLVTVTGPGGVGKSRLALETARQLTREFADGAYLVALAGTVDPALVTSAIADALELPERDRQSADLLWRSLRRRRALLLLDNCEHLIEAVAEVAASILAACPEIRLLTTSRERLRIPGEITFGLSPLQFPGTAPRTLEEAAQYPAVRLLLDRASMRPVEVDGAGIESIAPLLEIVRRLDGLPLAIELAAPLLRIFTPTELVQRLIDRFAILASGHRGTLPRHRSLRALIDWSYEQLSEEERFVFRRCSVFAGSFSLAAVVSVCAGDDRPESEVVETFVSLVEKSLIDVSAQAAGRYRLLDLIKAYARGASANAGESAALSRKHAEYFLEVAREARVGFFTHSFESFRMLKPEAENLEAALTWAINEDGDVTLGASLAISLDVFFFQHSFMRSRHWFERALELLDRTEEPELVAKVVTRLAYFMLDSPDIVRLVPDLETAVTIARRKGEPLMLADALGWLAFALASGGDYERAHRAGSEAVSAARAAPPPILAEALRSYAAVAVDDPVLQRSLLEESLALFATESPDVRIVPVLSALGEVMFLCGDAATAIARTREANEVDRKMTVAPMGTGIAARLGNIAGFELARGELSAGVAAAREALQLSLQTGDPILTACMVQHFAMACALRGDWRRAVSLLGFVLSRAGAVNSLTMRLDLHFREHLMQLLATALPQEEQAELLRIGGAWDEERAVEEALAVV
jgi:predicted ATPase/transcriptional regulator with XRE-family HTH domain